MDSFPGDYYGYRCHSGKKSSDIFNDYLDLLDGVLAYDEYEINWQLTNDATAEEFESWERHMLQGFLQMCIHVWLLQTDAWMRSYTVGGIKRCGRRALPLQLGRILGNFYESALYLLVPWWYLWK
jgi:hypothetical protein